jgi:HEAT repeat protein
MNPRQILNRDNWQLPEVVRCRRLLRWMAGGLALGAGVLLSGHSHILAAGRPGDVPPARQAPSLCERDAEGPDEEEVVRLRLFNDLAGKHPERTPRPVADGTYPGTVAPRTVDSATVRARIRAVEAWGQAGGAQGVAGCLGALQDAHPSVRRSAARTLARLDPPLVFRAVLDTLSTGSARDVRALDEALPLLRGSLETPMTGVLRAGDSQGMSRPAAAYALGRMGSRAAGPLLAESAWSENPTLAALCADAMISTASEAAVPWYVPLTQHPNPDLRMAAVHALGRTSGSQTVAALEEVAFGANEPTREVRVAAIAYLGTVGDSRTVPKLIAVMRRFPWSQPAAAHTLRRLTGAELGTSPLEWEQWRDAAPPPPPESVFPPLSGPGAGTPAGQEALTFPRVNAADLFRGAPGPQASPPEPGDRE